GVAELPAFGRGYRFHVTGLMHDERGYPTSDPTVAAALLARLERKVAPAVDLVLPETYRLEDARVVLVAYGITARIARAAVDALREQGVPAGLWRPRLLWPVPELALARALAGAELVVVAEMNRGQWVREVDRVLGPQAPSAPYLKAGGSVITAEELTQHVLGAARAAAVVS
ncbi:MAG TPA: transketolase C-terminal domain-containing protein, partial [Candidatus Dormibacteraeota bacterium]|nr:transketolase C-terminal domain-containing protein [Candidatus Dormibacteraeota bacterium]